MVTQPAYLKTLKEYARAQYGSADDARAVASDLYQESDRGAVILAATGIEDTLEWALLDRMKPLHTDSSARSEMFTAKGCAATFSDKTLLAYSLGVIDRETRKQVDLIREIRNACAHSRKPISFSVPALQKACKVVIGSPMLDEIKDHEPATLRDAFIITCNLVQRYILTGKKMTPLEAYWEAVRLTQEGKI